jgi:hypothetical protein
MGWFHLDQHRGVAGCSEYGNEHSGSIKGDEFLDQIRDCFLFKKACFVELEFGSFTLDCITQYFLIQIWEPTINFNSVVQGPLNVCSFWANQEILYFYRT